MSRPSVIARLTGGIGNQLFMFAFNKAMAERNGVPLKIDTVAGFIHDRRFKRTHLLQYLLPEEDSPSRWESRRFPLGRWMGKIDRSINRRRALADRYHIEEPDLRYHAEIKHLRITRPTVFNGYWQAPQYFDDLQPPFVDRISFPDELIAPLGEDLARIQAAGDHAVCLAIRRYEELSGSSHPIVQLDYFERAMARIEEGQPDPHYFVFAQDMDWAREHIRSKHPVTFASRRDGHRGVIQDLYLMTQCRHFILSNSSLHWWAAWLNRSSAKMVVCPQEGWPNSDMLPDTWIQLA